MLQEDAILHSEDVSTKLLGNRGKGFWGRGPGALPEPQNERSARGGGSGAAAEPNVHSWSCFPQSLRKMAIITTHLQYQ